MEKKIVNNLKNNTVGSYIGGDQVVNHYYGPETKKGSMMKKKQRIKRYFFLTTGMMEILQNESTDIYRVFPG